MLESIKFDREKYGRFNDSSDNDTELLNMDELSDSSISSCSSELNFSRIVEILKDKNFNYMFSAAKCKKEKAIVLETLGKIADNATFLNRECEKSQKLLRDLKTNLYSIQNKVRELRGRKLYLQNTRTILENIGLLLEPFGVIINKIETGTFFNYVVLGISANVRRNIDAIDTTINNSKHFLKN
jgi:hypothetical protein